MSYSNNMQKMRQIFNLIIKAEQLAKKGDDKYLEKLYQAELLIHDDLPNKELFKQNVKTAKKRCKEFYKRSTDIDLLLIKARELAIKGSPKYKEYILRIINLKNYKINQRVLSQKIEQITNLYTVNSKKKLKPLRTYQKDLRIMQSAFQKLNKRKNSGQNDEIISRIEF